MTASFQKYGGNCKFMLYSLLSNKFAKAMFYIELWSVCSAPPGLASLSTRIRLIVS